MVLCSPFSFTCCALSASLVFSERPLGGCSSRPSCILVFPRSRRDMCSLGFGFVFVYTAISTSIIAAGRGRWTARVWHCVSCDGCIRLLTAFQRWSCQSIHNPIPLLSPTSFRARASRVQWRLCAPTTLCPETQADFRWRWNSRAPWREGWLQRSPSLLLQFPGASADLSVFFSAFRFRVPPVDAGSGCHQGVFFQFVENASSGPSRSRCRRGTLVGVSLVPSRDIP